ncbi:MAG: ABC transporter substrate-binding protein [Defluviitaleaceae bacterium]|nr:ABC transporter substrate-binding protein [Defluviitaleaceae bacterium]
MKRLLLLPLLLLILAACGGESPDLARLDPNFAAYPAQESGEAQAPAQQEQTAQPPALPNHLTIAMPMPATLNPLLNSDPYLAQVLRLVFEPIVIFDEELRPITNPAITENITFAPSGQSLTITLRPNIFWEDGMPITSADLAFSIDVLRNQAPQTAVYRPNVAYVASHNVVDSRTLHINLNSPMWQFKYLLDFPIIPEHYYHPVSMTNLQAPRNMHPVGNGPFRFYSHTLANRLEFIANANAVGGRPYIQQVTALILRDMGDATHAFEQGLIDILPASPAEYGRFRAMGKKNAAPIAANYFDFIGFNMERTIFAEYQVRRAIDGAMDGHRLRSPINPMCWMHIHPQPAEAATFADAGFVRGEDGFLQRQISPALPPMPLTLDIIVNVDNSQTAPIAQLLAEVLATEGANVTLHTLPFYDFESRLEAGDYDLVVGTAPVGMRPNLGFSMGYSSHNLLALQSMANNAANPAALQSAAAELQQYFSDNLPIITIAFHNQFLYTTNRVYGSFTPTAGDIFRNASSWRLH